MTSTLPPVVVEATRHDQRDGTDHVESRHRGHVVVVGPDDEVAIAIGDAEQVTFFRSAVKPWQALASLAILEEHGVPLPSEEELAVSWASHRAEPIHLRAVRTLLDRSGTPPDQLTCPEALSVDPAAGWARLHHNCSGKHALFALAGRALGCSRERLLDPAGPLQTRVLAELGRAFGPSRAIAVDGCGAPAIAAPLDALARGFRRLADQAGVPVVEAGHAHPTLVGGTGRLETALLGAGITAKPGAEGVFAAAWRDDRGCWGLALKIEDGAARAAEAAAYAVVTALGVAAADLWEAPAVLGGGAPVGRVVATGDLVRAVAGRA